MGSYKDSRYLAKYGIVDVHYLYSVLEKLKVGEIYI